MKIHTPITHNQDYLKQNSEFRVTSPQDLHLFIQLLTTLYPSPPINLKINHNKQFFHHFRSVRTLQNLDISFSSIILFMQTQPYVLKCLGSNPVVRVCCLVDCKQVPFMCKQQQCQCQSHQHCDSTNLQSLNKKLSQKGKSVIPYYEILADWYQSHIKEFTIKFEEIKSILQSQKMIFTGDEQNLHNLLIQKKYKQVTSQLVNKVLNSLRKQPEYDLKDKIPNLKKKLEERSKEMSQTLSKIKQYSKMGEQKIEVIIDDVKFSTTYHSNDIQLINYNCNARMKNPPSQAYYTALLSDSVQKFQNKKQTYRFKIIRTQNRYMMFGLCHFHTVTQRGYYGHYQSGSGGYVVQSYNGSICTHDTQQIIRGQDRISHMQVNDVVEVIYSPLEDKLEFRNVTKKKRDSIRVQTIPGNPLYPCVVMSTPFDQVQLLNVQIEQ